VITRFASSTLIVVIIPHQGIWPDEADANESQTILQNVFTGFPSKDNCLKEY
jgi:hypothetical protein